LTSIEPRVTVSGSEDNPEIDIHTGVNDKTLVEFVINLSSPRHFPNSRKIWVMSEQAFQILSSKKWTGSSSICIRTTKKPATSPTNTDLLTEEDKKKLFPGLSKPDQDWQPFNGEGDGDEKS
jgi:hypothetical protein